MNPIDSIARYLVLGERWLARGDNTAEEPPPLPRATDGAGRSLPRPHAPGELARPLLDGIARRSGVAPGPVEERALSTLLDAAVSGSSPGLVDREDLRPILYVAAFSVSGLPSGTYRHERLEHALVAVPGARPRAIQRAIQEPEHRSAAAVLFFVAPLAAWLRAHGDRGYRGVSLATGFALDRLTLVTEALGLSGTAALGFCPGMLDELLGLSGIDRASFAAFVVGGPRTVS
jgi:hypothetical protein